MKKITHLLLVLAALLLGVHAGWSQEKGTEEKPKIVIIKKTVDENGQEVVEKIIREGDVGEDMEWTDENGNVIRIEKDGPEINVRVETDGKELNFPESEGTEDLHIEHRDLEGGQYFFFREGADGPVYEWSGQGEVPEEIRRKMVELGLNWENRAEAASPAEKRPFLGVMVGKKEELENVNGVETRKESSDGVGVEVLEVMEGSAAEAAGLQVGDMVTAIGGQAANSPEELIKLIGGYVPGDEITIDYRREGEAAQVRAVLGENASAPVEKTFDIKINKEGDGQQQFFYFNDGGENDNKEVHQRVIIISKDGQGSNVEIHGVETEAPVVDMPERRLELTGFEAFPNPTGGQLTIQFQAEPGPTVFTITDVLGREIHRQEIDDFDGRYNQQIDVRSAAKGALLLTIRQGERVFTEKVLLK